MRVQTGVPGERVRGWVQVGGGGLPVERKGQGKGVGGKAHESTLEEL